MAVGDGGGLTFSAASACRWVRSRCLGDLGDWCGRKDPSETVSGAQIVSQGCLTGTLYAPPLGRSRAPLYVYLLMLPPWTCLCGRTLFLHPRASMVLNRPLTWVSLLLTLGRYSEHKVCTRHEQGKEHKTKQQPRDHHKFQLMGWSVSRCTGRRPDYKNPGTVYF